MAPHARRQTELSGPIGRRGAGRYRRVLRGEEVARSPRKALRFGRLHVIAKLEHLEPTSTVHKHRGIKGWGTERTNERTVMTPPRIVVEAGDIHMRSHQQHRENDT